MFELDRRAFAALAFLGAGLLAAPLAAELAAQEWRQGVEYHIEARLDEDREALRARARLTYRNRSPDTLDRLYFHQHLNAFRPNSEWARAERRERYDFQSLPDHEQAYERLLGARSLPAGAGGSDIVGRDLRWAYPLAPDSTVLEIRLLDVLEPGEEVTLELDWEARPSILCRRQCRAGRHYDFAQWYPRIAPYEADGWAAHPLYPQGEFYGEFGRYDVTLELASDQVVGATGAVVSGDPGWGVEPDPVPRYLSPPTGPRLGLLPVTPPRGRKRVRFYAEDVHHFAWTTSPEYVHEGGRVPPTEAREHEIDVHVLYRPGDEAEWGGGRAVDRTVAALEWLEDVFGPYPWPQLTNAHRLEGGGTEFPMLIMDGSADQGLITHETAHQWVHGIFGNNEWREAWLDEGFASFLTTWRLQGEGPDPWRRMREAMAPMEGAGFARPIATDSEEFESYPMYGYMAYNRGAFVFRMLRGLVGEDTFRAILREYYERHALGRVTEADFRATVEDVAGEDLDWFFDQWLHTTATLDYGVEEVEVEATDGGWRIRAAVGRAGEAWMPVTLAAVRGGEIVARERLEDRSRRQSVELEVEELPDELLLDPGGWILDADPGNDRRPIEPSGGPVEPRLPSADPGPGYSAAVAASVGAWSSR